MHESTDPKPTPSALADATQVLDWAALTLTGSATLLAMLADVTARRGIPENSRADAPQFIASVRGLVVVALEIIRQSQKTEAAVLTAIHGPPPSSSACPSSTSRAPSARAT